MFLKYVKCLILSSHSWHKNKEKSASTHTSENVSLLVCQQFFYEKKKKNHKLNS